MKTFLMCEPRYFEVSYVINPWMAANIGRVNKSLASKQWNHLYNTLSQKASIKLVEPVAGLPDMVFTANAGLVNSMQEVIISTFRHVERQGESQYFKKFFVDAGYQVKQLAANTVFEGAGDALFDADGELWLGSGLRSDVTAITEIARTVSLYSLARSKPRRAYPSIKYRYFCVNSKSKFHRANIRAMLRSSPILHGKPLCYNIRLAIT